MNTENKTQSLLEVKNLHVKFPVSSHGFGKNKKVSFVHALNGINFQLNKGETLGLVGESGCGKSTTAHAIVQLCKSSEGSILYQNNDISKMSKKEALKLKKNIQIIFQDPYSSLNPRMTIQSILAEPLQVYAKHGIINVSHNEMNTRINEVLVKVGLSADVKQRYPHNFSGGQRQRISIARALMLEPKIILADESVSALDVSIQAQIINLLKQLQKELDLALLFISHDLAVVKHISHKVAIMYCGKIVETGDVEELYNNPQHPYTQALLSAVNFPDPVLEKKRKRILLSGNVPSLTAIPKGCPFYQRCMHAMPKCQESNPSLQQISKSPIKHKTACFLHSST